MERLDKGELRRRWELRRKRYQARRLGDAVGRFMKQEVFKRHKKTGKLAEAWVELLPEELIEHSCLESFQGGTLGVLVDSAAHLAEIDLLVREGLLDQLRERCPRAPLARIRLKRGRWYREDEEGNQIAEFDT